GNSSESGIGPSEIARFAVKRAGERDGTARVCPFAFQRQHPLDQRDHFVMPRLVGQRALRRFIENWGLNYPAADATNQQWIQDRCFTPSRKGQIMDRHGRLRIDEVGNWSEIKLEIIKKYASAYSTILSKQKLQHVYIDAFAGAGVHVSKTTGKTITGSPLNALEVNPPFREYHFIDLDRAKVEALRNAVGTRGDVFLYDEDCNPLLLDRILPSVAYERYRRALCILDPYALHLDWAVIEKAGAMGTVEIFLNFPVYDMNRNVFWHNPQGVSPDDIERMNRFWGDESWRQAAYRVDEDMFGEIEKKTDNETVAEAFRQRLRKVAKFEHVPPPVPMRNSRNAIVYYLFFAAHKPVAAKIVAEIFDKYRSRGF
ncbi:MAG: three-Cys-motif partner protein TcmP, partial [Candidatus Sumerlaeota bacterium]|nr:three-Cys-motif partner protein TcmP [Candidatus Sumerlaeota bacterium]